MTLLSFLFRLEYENGENFMMNQQRRIVVFGIQTFRPIQKKKSIIVLLYHEMDKLSPFIHKMLQKFC